MNLAFQLKGLIEEYLKSYRQGLIEKPTRCKRCGKKGCLIWHGKYTRGLIALSGRYELPIKRVYCKECGHTLGVLPPFVIKYRRYGYDVIAYGLDPSKRRTQEELLTDLVTTYEIELALETLWHWKKIAPEILNSLLPLSTIS